MIQLAPNIRQQKMIYSSILRNGSTLCAHAGPKAAVLVALHAVLAVVLAGCGSGDNLDAADRYMIDGVAAAEAGRHSEAIEKFTIVLDTQQDVWAYYERARSYLVLENVDLARADCEAGLRLHPTNKDLRWLLAEVQKPKTVRFQGRNAEPPRNSK